MNINFLPPKNGIPWVKIAWTLLSIQVTGLQHSAVTFMNNLGLIKILCSNTKDNKIFPFQQMSH